jgi:PAS domain S-box-containing protein
VSNRLTAQLISLVSRSSNRDELSSGAPAEDAAAPQCEQWTQDIIALMAQVISLGAALITAGNFAGIFAWRDTFPVYLLLAVILPAAWLTCRGKKIHPHAWRWTRWIPILMCFALGATGSFVNGYLTTFMLFYALAVLLAGMMLGYLARQITAGVGMITYIGLGIRADGLTLENIPPIILFIFSLSGIAILQTYNDRRVRKALEQQLAINARLQAEISRRETAENLQREQDAQLRRLAENMSDLIVEMDPGGRLTYLSPSHQASLGYASEDLDGRNVYDFIHPEDLTPALEAASRAAREGHPERIEVRVRHADGRYLYFDVSGKATYTCSGELAGFVLSSRDIDRRKQVEEALVASENQFRSVIEALPLGVMLFALDEDGRLVVRGHNPATEAILGPAAQDINGQPLEKAFSGLVDTDIPQRFKAVATRGDSLKLDHFAYDFGGLRGIFRVNAFQTTPGNLVVVFEDETGRLAAAEALELSEEKFSTAFLTSPDAININRLSDGLYMDINQGFTRLVGYTREEAIGKTSSELNIWADPTDRLRLVKALVEKGEVNNLEARFRLKNGDVRIGLMSARPMVIQGEKCVLSITRDIHDWIRAEEQLREAHFRLEHAYEVTLEGWARALELRERETAGHSRRVVSLTLEIARHLGYEGEALTHIRRGALLHDIGKLGVPDKILLKPDALTSEEWVIMRQHPEFARSLLEGIEYLKPSIPIPYAHHEKWDGSGYPLGLRGEQIPLSARIFAVADVFEALTSDRPYRPKWSTADAVSYLHEQSGKHFDPRVLDLFLIVIQSTQSYRSNQVQG